MHKITKTIGVAILALSAYFGMNQIKPIEPMAGATGELWKLISNHVRPSIDSWTVYAPTNLRFDGEILPDGSTCSDGQVIQKTGANNWDCVTSTTGTVTSVAQTVPTGFTVAGSPVTSTGTLAISYAAGYSLPLTASQSAWEGFYDTPSTRITATSPLAWTVNALGIASGFTVPLTASVSAWEGFYDVPSTRISLATGLTWTANTIGYQSGYSPLLTASASAWESFYDTPSTRITAGSGLSWTGNTISATGRSFTGLDFGYLNGSQVKITSQSFDANQFVLSNLASQGNVRLNWTSGPASRSMANTWTAVNTFSNGVSISAGGLEIIGGHASISFTTVAGALTDQTDTNGILNITGTGATNPRITYKSNSATVAIIQNYQTGKDVFWGEASDTGNYVFRGRTGRFDNNASISGSLEVTAITDPVFSNGPVGAQLLMQNSASARGMYFGYDNTLGSGYIGAARYGSTNQPILLNPDGYLGVGGNVGVGTRIPEERFEVAGNIIASSSDDVYLKLRSSTTNGDVNNNDAQFTIQTGSASEQLMFKNGAGAELVHIASNGQFLIQQGSNTHGLNVNYTGNNRWAMTNNTSCTTCLQSFSVIANETGANQQMFSSGYTTSGSAIASSYRIIALDPGGMSLVSSHATGGVLRFYLGAVSTERARFDAIGRLGLGTTTPVQELHIASASDGNIMRLADSDGTCDHNPEAGGETVTCSSDGRLKSNIINYTSALAFLNDFMVREYTVNASGEKRVGVIAQELQKKHPELVTVGTDGYLMVENPNDWILVGAIQELNKKIDSIYSPQTLEQQLDSISFLSLLKLLLLKIIR